MVGVFSVVLLAAVGVEQARVRADAERFPRLGRAFEVDGAEMNALALGRGGPVVVLDAGLGGSLHTWAWVQREVARHTRVVSFDRPGMGYSEPVERPRTADEIARELRGLLQAMGEPPPYVLVGHSLGGFTVRAFAALFGDEVAGVVFVDAAHEEEDARRAEIGIEEGQLMNLLSVVRHTTALGGGRVLGALRLLPPLEILDPLPEPVAARVRSEFLRGPALDTYYRENRDFAESARWIARTGDLGDRPLVVLSRDFRGRVDPQDAISAELQGDLAALSTRAEMREIPGSWHSSTVLAERHAAVVSRCIIEMAHQIRAQPAAGAALASR